MDFETSLGNGIHPRMKASPKDLVRDRTYLIGLVPLSRVQKTPLRPVSVSPVPLETAYWMECDPGTNNIRYFAFEARGRSVGRRQRTTCRSSTATLMGKDLGPFSHRICVTVNDGPSSRPLSTIHSKACKTSLGRVLRGTDRYIYDGVHTMTIYLLDVTADGFRL